MEVTIFQTILIILIMIITPTGFLNMRRRQNKKIEQELLGDEIYSIQPSSQENIDVSEQTESQIKKYIEQYKSTYPKESIEQGILAFGITVEQAKKFTQKYF